MNGSTDTATADLPAATVERRIEFSDVDLSGRYHYSTAIRLLEAAEVELLERIGLLDDTYTSMPRAHVEFDFHVPLRLRDLATVTIRVAAIGRSSVTFTCEIRRGDETCATGKLVAVHVDDGGRPLAWSADQHHRLQGLVSSGSKPG